MLINLMLHFSAVLMVVGNPDVLMADTDWRKLIMNCCSNGTYYGCNLPPAFDQITI